MQMLIVKCDEATIESLNGFFKIYGGLFTYDVIGGKVGFTAKLQTDLSVEEFALESKFVFWAKKFGPKYTLVRDYLE